MSERVFVKNFEQFQGLDYKATPLTDSILSAEQLTNFQSSETKGITGRFGHQIIGRRGAFNSMGTFVFTDKARGTTRPVLVAANRGLWKKAYETLTVTGANTQYLQRLDTATGKYRFTISTGGVAYTLTDPVTAAANPYLALGTGLEVDIDIVGFDNTKRLITIYDLYEAINATALTCTPPIRSGRVYQNSVGNQQYVDVTAGHNIALGDVIMLWSWNPVISENLLYAVQAASITPAGPYDRIAWNDPETIVSYQNQVVGVGCAAAAGIRINNTPTADDPSVVISYEYWEPISSDSSAASVTGSNFVSFNNRNEYFDAQFYRDRAEDWIGVSFANVNQSLYSSGYVPGNQDILYGDTEVSGTPHKYDGVANYRAGLPPASSSDFAVVGAAGALAGKYTWAYTYAFTDANGVEIESNISNDITATLSAQQGNLTIPLMWAGEHVATTAGAAVGSTITVNAGHLVAVGDYIVFAKTTATQFFVGFVIGTTATTIVLSVSTGATGWGAGTKIFKANRGFHYRGATVNLNTAVTTLSVQQGGIAATSWLPEVGDNVYLYGASTVERKATVTARNNYTAGAFTLTTDQTWTTALGDHVSTIAVKLYRTKAGGVKKYLVKTLPCPIQPTAANTLTFTFSDNTADSLLTIEYDKPPTFKESDPPPRAAILTEHQGSLVFSRILGQPNAVAFSRSGLPEYVPLASNYFDVPSSIQSSITAIASDTDDKLAVFKETAYYDVSGSLDDNAFSIRKVTEGDYGVSSSRGLVKFGTGLLGLGSLGFISIQDGDLNPLVSENINPAIWNNAKLALPKSIGFNDPITRQVKFWIPAYNYDADSDQNKTYRFSVDSSLCYVLDYSHPNKPTWFDWSYDRSIAPSGGWANEYPESYHLALNYSDAIEPSNSDSNYGGVAFRCLNGVQDPTLSAANYPLLFADNHLAIPYTWVTGWEALGEPSVLKQWLRIRLYAFPSSLELSNSFSATVTAYKDKFSGASGTYTITLLNNNFSSIIKLPSESAYFRQFKFVTNTIQTCPYYSGVELVVLANYKKEDFIR